MIKIFVLASGRSGTKFLSGLFKYNVKNCVSKHEPVIPDMFGKPTYWYQRGETDKIRDLFLVKRDRINRYKTDVYIETNHAFLKSFSDVAMEFFPDMKLIHLVRNPFKVARSELNRESWINDGPVKAIFPTYRYYRASDGKKYFRWALTGNEEIFKEVKLKQLTPYQKYVVQWVEIENRAISFLDIYNKNDDCFTLSVPKELNDPKVLKKMFDFFDLELKGEDIVIKGDENKIKIATVVSNKDEEEFKQVINALPDKYLKIFRKEPYTRFEWADLLKKK
jgi:hypothetical protein